MNPSAALQSTAEDFLESLSTSPGPSQAELINCVLRSCGCNDSVNGDEVVDYDGVVDALDNFTEALKQVRNLFCQRSLLLTIDWCMRRMIHQFTPSHQNCRHSRSSASPSQNSFPVSSVLLLLSANFIPPNLCQLCKHGSLLCLHPRYVHSDIPPQ